MGAQKKFLIKTGKLDKHGKPNPTTPATWIQYFKTDTDNNITEKAAVEKTETAPVLEKRPAEKQIAVEKKVTKKKKKVAKKAESSDSDSDDSDSSSSEEKPV